MAEMALQLKVYPTLGEYQNLVPAPAARSSHPPETAAPGDLMLPSGPLQATIITCPYTLAAIRGHTKYVKIKITLIKI